MYKQADFQMNIQELRGKLFSRFSDRRQSYICAKIHLSNYEKILFGFNFVCWRFVPPNRSP